MVVTPGGRDEVDVGPGRWTWDPVSQSWSERREYEVGPPPDWKAYVDRAIADALALMGKGSKP